MHNIKISLRWNTACRQSIPRVFSSRVPSGMSVVPFSPTLTANDRCEDFFLPKLFKKCATRWPEPKITRKITNSATKQYIFRSILKKNIMSVVFICFTGVLFPSFLLLSHLNYLIHQYYKRTVMGKFITFLFRWLWFFSIFHGLLCGWLLFTVTFWRDSYGRLFTIAFWFSITVTVL